MAFGCGCTGKMGHVGRRGVGRLKARQRAIGDLQTTSTAAFTSYAQGKINSLGASGAAQLQASTGVDVTNSRISGGASDAVSLAQNGFNPSSMADNQKLVGAIAGGLCLIPAIGPAAGAAVEALWQTYAAAACPVEQFFASIGMSTLPPACGGAACKSSGNWTAAGILSTNAIALPSMPTGSFASLVVPALAMQSAQLANCRTAMPPALIVDACVALWNKVHAGPAVAYLVPPLYLGGYAAGKIIPTWQNISGSTASAKAGKDPWAYYAFQPASAAAREAGNNATSAATVARSFSVAPQGGGFGPTTTTYTPARLVMVNTGALQPPPPPPAPAGNPRTIRLSLTPAVLALAHSGQTKAAAPKPSSSLGTVAVVGVAGVAAVAIFKPALFAKLLRSAGIKRRL